MYKEQTNRSVAEEKMKIEIYYKKSTVRCDFCFSLPAPIAFKHYAENCISKVNEPIENL